MSVVAIIGSGNVGRSLASRLIGAGHTVRFGARDAAKARAALGPGLDGVFVGDGADAARGADVLILAVPAAAAVSAAQQAAPSPQTVVVDATNPLRWDGGPVWNPPAEGSNTAAIAAALPGHAVVKGFNHFGAEIMADPSTAHGAAHALFAGDDVAAKQRVMQLAQSIGFTARDAGALRNAAVLENLCVLWIQLATAGGLGRDYAFCIAPRR